MQEFKSMKQFFSENGVSDPFITYTAVWPLLTEYTRCQHSGRNKPTSKTGSQSLTMFVSRLDSQTSQATCPTGHNIHAQKKHSKS